MKLSEAILQIINEYEDVININSKSKDYQEGFIHALILLSELDDSADTEIVQRLLNAVK